MHGCVGGEVGQGREGRKRCLLDSAAAAAAAREGKEVCRCAIYITFFRV